MKRGRGRSCYPIAGRLRIGGPTESLRVSLSRFFQCRVAWRRRCAITGGERILDRPSAVLMSKDQSRQEPGRVDR
jgi:hypothetical protein